VVLRRKKREELENKIRAKLADTLNHDTNGVTQLLRDHAVQAAEVQKIAQRKATLERDLAAVETELAQAEKKLEEITKWLAVHKRPTDASGQEIPFDVDEASDPQDVWRKQLIKAIALDSALEDIMYTLDRALAAGKLPLDEYLKMCRTLCSEQFMTRALIRKIRETVQSAAHR